MFLLTCASSAAAFWRFQGTRLVMKSGIGSPARPIPSSFSADRCHRTRFASVSSTASGRAYSRTRPFGRWPRRFELDAAERHPSSHTRGCLRSAPWQAQAFISCCRSHPRTGFPHAWIHKLVRRPILRRSRRRSQSGSTSSVVMRVVLSLGATEQPKIGPIHDDPVLDRWRENLHAVPKQRAPVAVGPVADRDNAPWGLLRLFPRPKQPLTR